MLAGGVVLWLFFRWENRQLARGAEPLSTHRCCATRGCAAA